ncbi:MAG TPA: AI-2E family transporter [Bacillota bacterium]
MREAWLRTLIVSATLLALTALAWVLGRLLAYVLQTLAVLLVGAALALALKPAVEWLTRWLRWRGLAVIAVVALALTGLGAGVFVLAGPVQRDVERFIAALPEYAETLRGSLTAVERSLVARDLGVDVQRTLDSLLTQLQDDAARVVGGLLGWLGRLGTALVTLLLALVVAIYLLLSGPQLRAGWYARLPEPWAAAMRRIEAIAAEVFGGYLRGQLLLAIVIGILVGVGSVLFDLPHAFLSGVLAGLFALIPTLGAVLGGVLPVALALAKPFPTVLYVLGYLVLIQQLEGNLLAPRIVGQATGLHPLAVLLALLGGYEVGGIVGAFAAVPVVAFAWRLANAWPEIRQVWRAAMPMTPDPGAAQGAGWRGQGRANAVAPPAPADQDGAVTRKDGRWARWLPWRRRR